MTGTNLKVKYINDRKVVVYFDASLKLLFIMIICCLLLFFFMYPTFKSFAFIFLLLLLLPIATMANENVKMLINTDERKITVKNYILFGLIRKNNIVIFEDFSAFKIVGRDEVDKTKIDSIVFFFENLFRTIANLFGSVGLRKEDFYYFILKKKSGETLKIKFFEDTQLEYYKSAEKELNTFVQRFSLIKPK